MATDSLWDIPLSSIFGASKDDLIAVMTSMVQRTVLETTSRAFVESHALLLRMAERIGGSGSDEYEHKFPFDVKSAPGSYIVFREMLETETRFAGKWSCIPSNDEQPVDGLLTFELERDYIEFKMRME